MKNIRWKHVPRMNTYEGTIKGENEYVFSIQGGLCLMDMRPSRQEIWEEPKTYKTIGLTLNEVKQLAEDLVSGENFEVHEKNRLGVIAESERSAKIIQNAKRFLAELKERNK